MKRSLQILLVLAAVVVMGVSCGHKARVIPARKMQAIYEDMLLADQWLYDNPDKRAEADTSWFYEPVFKKYGYTREDYLKSVDYYLNDPERFADMMDKVRADLDKEGTSMQKELSRESEVRRKADSLAIAMKSSSASDLSVFDYYDLAAPYYGKVRFERKANGAFAIVRVPDEVSYDGPALIVKDSASVRDAVQMTAAPAGILRLDREGELQ